MKAEAANGSAKTKSVQPLSKSEAEALAVTSGATFLKGSATLVERSRVPAEILNELGPNQKVWQQGSNYIVESFDSTKTTVPMTIEQDNKVVAGELAVTADPSLDVFVKDTKGFRRQTVSLTTTGDSSNLSKWLRDAISKPGASQLDGPGGWQGPKVTVDRSGAGIQFTFNGKTTSVGLKPWGAD